MYVSKRNKERIEATHYRVYQFVCVCVCVCLLPCETVYMRIWVCACVNGQSIVICYSTTMIYALVSVLYV